MFDNEAEIYSGLQNKLYCTVVRQLFQMSHGMQGM